MKKMKVLVRQPVAVVLLLVLLGVSTHAASIVLFTSQREFQARLGVPQLVFNFNSLPDGVPESGQVALDGLTITSPDMRISGGAMNFGPFGLAASAPAPLMMNFASDVFSFGTEIVPFGGSGALNISVDGLTASFDVNAPGFIGFATDFPFRAFNATFVARPANPQVAMNFLIDNVIANTVPEPATLILLATGAGLVGLYTRRRKAVGERRDEAGEAGASRRM